MSDRPLTRIGLVYVTLVTCAGAFALEHGFVGLLEQPPRYDWLVLAVLIWATDAFVLKLPNVSVTISLSEAFVFTQFLLFGPSAAIVTVAVGGLISSVHRRNFQPRRLAFNIAEPALSLWMASVVFAWTSGVPLSEHHGAQLVDMLLPVFLMTCTYLLSNSWLLALAVAAEARSSPLVVWRQHVPWLSLNFFGGASIGLLLAINMREASVVSLGAALPLVAILYAAFKAWTTRAADAERHLSALNQLYFSTVEALATAIESKDQVTHGHVRRVQHCSLHLARALGIREEDQLRALEAAALLHDMGKVAIPDHLLNKPGKLTPPEYERIKLHAPIGAEILASVEFPYPVVPIVRHHHENWDGTGYPDGLRGEAIPVGARILSVVDCYDALTSDRPYRPALTHEQAIAIIGERKGTMYDPAVVDTFGRIVLSLPEAPAGAPNVTRALALIAQVGAATPASPPADSLVVPAHIDVAAACRQAPAALASLSPQFALAGLATVVRHAIRADLAIVYAADEASERLWCVHASGIGEEAVAGRSIAVGHGVSGWVVASGERAVNASVRLDLGEIRDRAIDTLQTMLAVPIVHSDGPVGVMSFYSARPDQFLDVHAAAAADAAAALGGIVAGLRPRANVRPAGASSGLGSETVDPPRPAGTVIPWPVETGVAVRPSRPPCSKASGARE